ncbi:DUF2141 domain-containing protein [Ferrovibrio sp.]|uniref:DUF2141 domain-containing protein n=1 Tax=Ferrovibrio sp. TaxID=1917215 RepID=UPI00311DC4DC
MPRYTFPCAALCSALAVAVLAAAAGPARAGDLLVEMTGMEGDEGIATAVLYDSADGFGKPFFAIARVQTKPRDGMARFMIGGLPPGRYAVVGFHDIDRDEHIKRDDRGRPQEPYGFSRDARGAGGPPAFEDAAVTVGGAGSMAATSFRLAK